MMSYAGLPHADVESSMRLVGKEVLPELKSWGIGTAAKSSLVHEA